MVRKRDSHGTALFIYSWSALHATQRPKKFQLFVLQNFGPPGAYEPSAYVLLHAFFTSNNRPINSSAYFWRNHIFTAHGYLLNPMQYSLCLSAALPLCWVRLALFRGIVPLQNSWIVLNHKINMLFNHHLILPAARHVRKAIELMLVQPGIYFQVRKLSAEMHDRRGW